MRKKMILVTMMIFTVVLLASCRRASSVALDWDVISDDLTIDTSEEVTITFWHTMSKTTNPALGQQALLEVFIEEFEREYPHITVLHEQKGGYDELRNAVNTALPAGNEPSMVYSYPDHVSGYINSGLALPLNNLIYNKNSDIALSQEDIDDFVDGYWSEGSTYDNEGTILNLPFVKSTEVLFYNKTFFEKNSLTVPSTWEEVKTVSKQIKEIDNTVTPIGYDSESNLFITASEQWGAPYTSINDDLEGQIDFVNDESKAMVAYFKDMYDKGYLTTKEMLGGDYTSNRFKAQSLMMSVGSTGGTNYNIPDGGLFEVGVAPHPQYDENNQKVIQQGPNINLFYKDNVQEMIAAWLFLKYITDTDQTSRWAIATGYSPVRKSAFDIVNNYYEDKESLTVKQEVFKNVAQVAQAQIPYYFTSPAFDKSSKAREQVGVLFVDVFNENYTIDEAFDNAYEETVF